MKNGKLLSVLLAVVGSVIISFQTYNTMLLNWTRQDVKEIKENVRKVEENMNKKVDNEQYQRDKAEAKEYFKERINVVENKIANIKY